jgi:hypothetical protein
VRFDAVVNTASGAFSYVLNPATTVDFTLSGAFGDCTVSGTEPYHQPPSPDAVVKIKFGPKSRYSSLIQVQAGFFVRGTITCPPTGPLPYAVELSGQPWLNTGRWRRFDDPGLATLSDEFDAPLYSDTWNFDAADE